MVSNLAKLRGMGAIKVISVALEASIYFLLGVLACYVHYYFIPHDTSAFVSRWEGGCAGWTRELASRHIVGNLALWWSYSAIAVTILRLHPVVTYVWESRATIYLTGAFVMFCGLTHLVDAYSIFNPIYETQADFLLATAAVSVVSVFFVASGLIRVFNRIREAREIQEKRSRRK